MKHVPSFPIEIAEAIDGQNMQISSTMFDSRHTTGEENDKLADQYFSAMRDWLLGRDHFFIDNPDPFLGVDYSGLDLSECRFPFPVTGIMYRYEPERFGCDIDSLGPERAPLDRDRFVIAADIDDTRDESEKLIRILSFFKLDQNTPKHIGEPGSWVFNPVAAMIPREKLIDASEIIKPDEARFQMVSSLPGINDESFFEASERQGVSRSELANLIADDIRLAMGFLAISSAKNVPIERLSAPEKLNRKRAKRGKYPLPGYHVLDLGFGRRTETAGDGSGRSHASPRLHTRRGHMRQCASGTITYVRQTLVGDPTKGAVTKDYRVRAKK